MSTRHLELEDVYTDGVTIYTGNSIRRVHKALDTQPFGALQALLQNGGSKVLRIPDESTFTVTAGSGLSVNIAPGAAIVTHSTYDAVFMQTRMATALAGLTANSTLYIFASIQISATGDSNDTRETGIPVFIFSESDAINGAVQLAQVVTGASSVTGVTDLRDIFPENTGDQTLSVNSNQLTISGENGNTVTLPFVLNDGGHLAVGVKDGGEVYFTRSNDGVHWKTPILVTTIAGVKAADVYSMFLSGSTKLIISDGSTFMIESNDYGATWGAIEND